MPTSREETLLALGRHGKVTGGSGFIYGSVAEVHSSGDYVLFARSGRFKPVWRHRRDLDLHETASWAIQVPAKPTDPSHA